MRTLLTTLAVALVVGLAPTVSEAACSITGTIDRVKMRNDTVSGNHVIYMRQFALDNFFFTANTTDDDLASLAGTLAGLQTRVRIKGNASACPTPPSVGGVTIGRVIDLLVVP